MSFLLLRMILIEISFPDELVHEKEKFKAISDELDQTFAEMSGYWKQKLLRSPTLSHQLSSLFLCVFSVQLASTPWMLFLLGSTQIAKTYWSNSGIIGHLYIFKLYRISANHTNVQLSPKKAICEIFAFLELRHRNQSMATVSKPFWYLHHHNYNQLYQHLSLLIYS